MAGGSIGIPSDSMVAATTSDMGNGNGGCSSEDWAGGWSVGGGWLVVAAQQVMRAAEKEAVL